MSIRLIDFRLNVETCCDFKALMMEPLIHKTLVEDAGRLMPKLLHSKSELNENIGSDSGHPAVAYHKCVRGSAGLKRVRRHQTNYISPNR